LKSFWRVSKPEINPYNMIAVVNSLVVRSEHKQIVGHIRKNFVRTS
jgi:hypothetical protein